MSCLICCFSFCNLCGCRNALLRITAFHPPKSSYEIISSENKPGTFQLALYDNNNEKFIPKDTDDITSKAFWLQTRNKNKIPAILFENSKSKYQTVILYSHGNSTDLGRMREILLDISFGLNVDVFAYEYSGYGPSSGKPSDINLLYDIEAAYIYLTEKLNYPWNRIMVYGRSIGSGPSVYIAASPYFRVGGLIIHSGLASGARILKFDIEKCPNDDLFPNSEMITYVKCHTIIMHGTDDTEVPIAHGKLLAAKAKNLYEAWWAKGAGHNDIDIKFRLNYFIKLANFLVFVKEFQEKLPPKIMQSNYAIENWILNSKHIYFKNNKHQLDMNLLNGSLEKLIDNSSFTSNISFLTIQNRAKSSLKEIIEHARSISDVNEKSNSKADEKESSILTRKMFQAEMELSNSIRIEDCNNSILRRGSEDPNNKKVSCTIQSNDLNASEINEKSPNNESYTAHNTTKSKTQGIINHQSILASISELKNTSTES